MLFAAKTALGRGLALLIGLLLFFGVVALKRLNA